MPSTERAARTGRRARLRQIMRSDAGSRRAAPKRSSTPAREARRRLGPHRLGGREREHAAHRGQGAGHRRERAQTPTAMPITVAPGSKRSTGKR